MSGCLRASRCRLVAGLLLVLALSAPACRKANGGASTDAGAAPEPPVKASANREAAPEPGPKAAHPAGGRVVFETASGPRAVDVELARTREETMRGLMGRRQLSPGRGMLFIFDGDEVRTFWMRNTLIPLDMIFVSKGGSVVGVVQNAEPLTDTPRTVGVPSRYVVEVPGGWASQYGIAAGTPCRIEMP